MSFPSRQSRGAAFLWVALAAMAAGQIESRPFAPRSQPDGATLFSALDGKRTGIVTTNRYDDPRMWGEYYRELTFGTMGTGIAIGDVDGDGRPDVFVVSKTETSRLFRNLGDWRFEDITRRAGLPFNEGEPGGKDWEQGASFADIDNDGDLDLYVCRFSAPNLLYLNRGDGTFTEEAGKRGLAVVDGSGIGAFCDYDRDGWIDVYVQTNMMDYVNNPDGRRDYLFRNDGDGTFTDVTVAAGIGGATAGHSATWCDFDDDGWPDLWVANDFATPDSYYHNNGDGTFTNAINAASVLSFYSMGSDFADVDGNGTFDLLVADMAATSHQKDQRSMAGSRVRGQKIDPASPVPPQLMRNALHLNTGAGRFREAAVLSGLQATDWTWSLRFEDFDNDGRVDLHVTNGMNREYHSADMLERIMISENPAEPIRIMRDSPVLAEQNLAFRNDGGLRFADVSKEWGLDQVGVSFGAATGDLDGDGDLDLVHGNYEGPPTVLRNDSAGGRRVTLSLRGSRSNRFGVGTVVSLRTTAGEQKRQLVPNRGYLSSSEPLLHFGLGEAERIQSLTLRWPSGAVQHFEDLAVDRHYTITEVMAEESERAAPVSPLFREVGRERGLALPGGERLVDEPNGQPLLPFRFNRPGPRVATGHLNGDDRLDLVVSGTSAEPPRILTGTSTGRFEVTEALGLAEGNSLPMGPLLLFDADGDGRDDLLVSRTGANVRLRGSAYQPVLFLNRGGFTAAPAGTLPELPISAGAVVAADFDRDGDTDVFVGGRIQPGDYPESPRSALLRNDGGAFSDITPEALREPGMITAAAAVDLDGDGWTDLVLATDWGPVQWWRGDGRGGFENRTEAAGFAAAGAGWWRSLAVADFNGDGRPDVAAGNAGLNTPYRAGPAVVILGNFNGRRRGASTLVEAYYEEGVLYPRRERKDLSAEVRSLQRRFRFTLDYADKSIEELFDAEDLAAAQRWEATEFRSGVFSSRPDGTWRFTPWPRLAQISPMMALAVDDVNDDGHADVIGGQNDHSPIDLVGPLAGGLGQILLGDGQGGFTAMEPAASGFVVPGAAKSVTVLDLNGDGRSEILVTRNNAPSLLFTR